MEAIVCGSNGYRVKEVIAERNGYRVKKVIDTNPGEPYDDGGTPIIMFDGKPLRGTDHRGISQVENITSYRVPPRIVKAARKFWLDYSPSEAYAIFERYLRAFHGATSVEWARGYSWGEPTYVTFTTPEWAEKVGASETATADMTQWKAYLEGDVYGIVVEREDTWLKSDDHEITMTTWEEVDSVWGFYGDNAYLNEECEAALADYADNGSENGK